MSTDSRLPPTEGTPSPHCRHVIEIAGALHGAVTRNQARAVLGEHGLRVALRQRRLVRCWRNVLADPARALDPRTRAAAALLLTGSRAVLTGSTAAWLHGCTAADTARIHVLLSYDRSVRSRRGLAVHSGRFQEEDVVELDGLRVLALDLVISELLCTASRPSALACADQALAAQPFELRGEFESAIVERLGTRWDRRGTRRANGLLHLVSGRAEAPPESWLRLLVVDAGLPLLVPQYEISDVDGRLLYRLDLSWPELRIALEYDGYQAHAGREAADAAREEDLRRRGWIVIRATAADLHNPSRLLRQLRGALRQRRFVA